MRIFGLYSGSKTRYSRTDGANADVTVSSTSAPKKAPAAAPQSRGRRMVQYALLAIGGIFFLDALVGDKGLVELVKTRQDFHSLQASLQKVRNENARLREEARLLREDADTIEKVARERLGLIKPGEKLFILKDVAPAKP
jgi:cell division protein DivIC